MLMMVTRYHSYRLKDRQVKVKLKRQDLSTRTNRSIATSAH